MYINSLERRYNLVEFSLYRAEGTTVYVLDLLLDCSVEEFEEKGLGATVTIEDGDYLLTFKDYEVSEYYEEDGCLRVVCVK